MLSRLWITSVLFALFLIFASQGAYAESLEPVIDKSSLNKGIFTVNSNSKDTKAIVRITKGNVKYDYNLANGAHYPLQLGDGNYNVMIAELIANNKYKVVLQENIDLKIENENSVYVQSIQLIDWNDATKSVAEAKKLTVGAKTDIDKVKAIYSYITKNIKYDYAKTETVEASYIPILDAVYDQASGICYDYAATFAAMVRSEGIPTRLMMGYEVNAPDVYHAWNQVFLKESNEWVTIDTTYDATRVQGGEETPMLKNTADYKVTQVY
ncbi:Transglutaminase-like superfamily protein [Paenibacillus sp. 1_12]|uniref:transglutaminase-like domain-containing protein n=1 Tax=Paenibacillus sp. 1_12 TaxID=1566278 RepID=UPI0008EF56FB|nr:transglutaminase-like domain-containing protein [Paenibacillus sp. 1_12]SFM22857.1 Transglutaminase-like superfamily protein [Paenibacillus sp. 1_12]